MKKNTIIGVVLLVIMTGTLVILISSSKLLLPSKFKDRYSTHNNDQEEQVQENIYENNISNDGEYREPERAPLKPLYNDDINLIHFTASAPATYKNLQVCLIYGPAQLNHKKYVTLAQALKNKMVNLIETEDVNELRLDNNSNEYIYINSGDIVKGGKQDRTIQYDVVIAPKEKGVDLASFCVESGRWTQRGNETVVGFTSSENSVSTKDLKKAMKYDKDQGKVWEEVAVYQDQTEININAERPANDKISVKNSVSESSLELTLEDEDIKKIQTEYRNNILKQLKNQSDVVGFAYFINGKLYNMDVYNNHKLFTDLFNKLLDAAIAEAISLYDSKKTIGKANPDEIGKLLIPNAKVCVDEEVNKNTQFKTSTHNAAKVLIFTTFDKKEKNWLHRNWLDDSEL